jgi:hypothetical protein
MLSAEPLRQLYCSCASFFRRFAALELTTIVSVANETRAFRMCTSNDKFHVTLPYLKLPIGASLAQVYTCFFIQSTAVLRLK